MLTPIVPFLSLLLSLIVVSPAMAGEPPIEAGAESVETDAAVTEVTSLGAAETLAALRAEYGNPSGLMIQSQVTRYTSGQSEGHKRPPLAISRSTAHLHLGADGDQIVELEHGVRYPYPFDLGWTETLANGTSGSIRGADEFGGKRRRDASQARLAFRHKDSRLSNPAWLFQEIEPTSISHADGTASLGALWRGFELELEIVNSVQIGAVRFEETYPPIGTVAIEVGFDDWRDVDGVPMPFKVVTRMAGEVVSIEVRDVVKVVAPPELSGDPAAPHADLTELGWQRSTFFLDWLGYGFPQDDAPIEHDQTLRSVRDGVWLVGGEFHNSVVIELEPGRLVVLEAPFSEARVDALFAAIEDAFPESVVEVAVMTHHHWDHAGGIAGISKRGIPLALPAGEVSWVQDLLGDDTLLRPVDEVLILEGEDRSVELHAFESSHVDHMLIAWMPQEKVLHVADLLNPGLIPTRGPMGWLVRQVLKAQYPFTLAKAGTYTTELKTGLDTLNIQPERITGGHGPQIARPHAIKVLMRNADPTLFHETMDGDRLDGDF